MALRHYVMVRVSYGIVMMLILLNLVFFVIRILPGNAAEVLAPPGATPAQIAQIAHQLGLDRPFWDQYTTYFEQLFTGNLGLSFITGLPVSYLLSQALPITLQLAIGSMIVAAIIGVGGGILSAYKGGAVDNAIRVWNLLWYATPIFWLGPMLQLLLGIYIPILPVAGAVSAKYYLPHITGMPTVDSILAGNIPAFGDAVLHMILPTITLGLLISGSISRVSRSEMFEALRKDHMGLARAKGLSLFNYLVNHGLRSVALPIVTIIGLEFASILGGAVVTEAVFNLPGMGTLLVNALNARDYPTMQGALALSVLWVGLMTIVIDLFYIVLDPRLR